MTAPRHIELLLTIGQIGAVISVALLLALGANALVSVQIVRSTPATPVASGARDDDALAAHAAHPSDNTLAFNRNLFNQAAAEPLDEDNTDEIEAGLNSDDDAAEANDAESVPESDLPLTLIAAMVADDPRWSVAYMRHNTTQEDVYARPGDSVSDATLVEVARTWVSVRRDDGNIEVITLGGEGAVRLPRDTQSASPRHATGGDWRRASAPTSPRPLGSTPFIRVESGMVTQGEDGSVVFDRRTIDAQAELDRTLAGALGLEAMNDGGHVTGYRIGTVTPNTMFEHMGLREGDVIIGVNGRRPHDKTTATKFVRDLSRKGEVMVEIDRRGERTKITLRAE